jgi:hypothetical protein
MYVRSSVGGAPACRSVELTAMTTRRRTVSVKAVSSVNRMDDASKKRAEALMVRVVRATLRCCNIRLPIGAKTYILARRRPRNSFDYSWVISAREVSRLSALIDPAKIISGGYPIPSRASRNQKTIDRFIGELSYGGGAVNQVNIHLFIESMPFGGVGPSGVDHYYGKHGFDMLTHAKTMPISAPDVAIDHRFLPYTNEKNEALKLWFEY